MATNVGISVTKTASGSGFVYTCTSLDATAQAGGWGVTSNAFDNVDDWTGIQEAIWQEVVRQLRQL